MDFFVVLCAIFMCVSVCYVAVAIFAFIKHQPGARSTYLKGSWEYAFLSLSCGFCSRWTREKFTWVHQTFPSSVFFCIVFLTHTARLFFFEDHSPIPWPLAQDFPSAFRFENPHVFENDFYVNAASSSIRIGIPFLVHALKSMGFSIPSIGLVLFFSLKTCVPAFTTWFVLAFCERFSQNLKTPLWIGIAACCITHVLNLQNGFVTQPFG